MQEDYLFYPSIAKVFLADCIWAFKIRKYLLSKSRSSARINKNPKNKNENKNQIYIYIYILMLHKGFYVLGVIFGV